MRWLLTGLVGLSLFGTSPPAVAEGTDGMAILKQSFEAVRQIEVVRYRAEGGGSGVLARKLPPMTGEVILQAMPGAPYPKARIEARVAPKGPQAPFEAVVTNDGSHVMVIDRGQRKYIKEPLPQGALMLNNVMALIMREYVDDNPFQRELKAAEVRHAGESTVGDELCDVLHVIYAEDGATAKWHIGRSDHLPRKVERVIPTPMGEATITTTVHDLTTDVQVEADRFVLTPPSGFEVAEQRPSTRSRRSGRRFLDEGSEAPAFTLKTPDGKAVSLKDLRGNVVLLDFWATWCGPCRKAMPHLQALHKKYAEKPVKVVGVSCWERRSSKKGPADFMKQHKYDYMLLVEGDRVASQYKVRGIPTFYLLDAKGKILYADSGFAPAIAERIEQLIEKELEALAAAG